MASNGELMEMCSRVHEIRYSDAKYFLNLEEKPKVSVKARAQGEMGQRKEAGGQDKCTSLGQ